MRNEEDYNDRLDDFAFAVTRGNLTQPDENNNWNTDATHYRNALDDVRYGTAKTILESVYAAAWNDSTHTALPDSVKLIDDRNRNGTAMMIRSGITKRSMNIPAFGSLGSVWVRISTITS